MEGFVKRDIVIMPFPFSDLSSSKRRPALIVAEIKGEDIILCEITSRPRIDEYSITLSDEDFNEGRLDVMSIIKPHRLFTAHKSIIIYRLGSLKQPKIKEVTDGIIKILNR